jgi:hypothetical protein
MLNLGDRDLLTVNFSMSLFMVVSFLTSQILFQICGYELPDTLDVWLA